MANIITFKGGAQSASLKFKVKSNKLKSAVMNLLIFCLVFSNLFLIKSSDVYGSSYKDAYISRMESYLGHYPTKNDIDPWRYYAVYCTSYAAFRAERAGWTGAKMPYAWGNAVNWYSKAKEAGLAVTTTPTKNSIAYWGGSIAGGYGHVAWVDDVVGDNVYLSEYNWSTRNGYGERIKSKSQAAEYYLVNISTEPPETFISFQLGYATDFNGDGKDDIGLRRGHQYFFNYDLEGPGEASLSWGRDGDQHFIGDFNGDGKDDIGLKRGNKFYFNFDLTGPGEGSLSWGRDTDLLMGAWIKAD